MLLILIILLAFCCWWFGVSDPEPIEGLQYASCSTQDLPKVEQIVLGEGNYTRTSGTNWNVFFPCGYSNAEKELRDNGNFASRRGGVVMGIPGMDKLAAKNSLWELFKARFGRMRAQIYVPETWVLYDPVEIALFLQTAKRGGYYIVKGNQQRQSKILISNKPNEISGMYNQGFVVVQEIKQNPYLIDGIKINNRVYVLVTCKGGKKTAYAHLNGFMYYSKAPYRMGNTWDEIITTGYGDRKFYETHPLTLFDFYSYLDQRSGAGTSDTYKKNLYFTLQGLMDAISGELCSGAAGADVTYSQLFGVDIQPNADLTSINIIEANKGADMSFKDERDKEVKLKVNRDMYQTLGLVNYDTPNQFVKFWESP